MRAGGVRGAGPLWWPQGAALGVAPRGVAVTGSPWRSAQPRAREARGSPRRSVRTELPGRPVSESACEELLLKTALPSAWRARLRGARGRPQPERRPPAWPAG